MDLHGRSLPYHWAQMICTKKTPLLLLAILAAAGCRVPELQAAELGKVEITVVDKVTGKPLAFRIRLENTDAKPRASQGQLLWGDQWSSVSAGTARFELPPGRYTYDVEHGPEYLTLSSLFVRSAPGNLEQVELALERIADMAAEGWWAGDMHVHHDVEVVELLMKAEDLQVAEVVTWWN